LVFVSNSGTPDFLGSGGRRRWWFNPSFSCQPLSSFSSFTLPLSLSSPIRLGYSFADRVFLVDIDVIKIYTVEQAIFHDLAHDLLFNLLRVQLRSAQ
jgi:hypothetical protein